MVKIRTAKLCAWHAVYVYAGERQLARIGIDSGAGCWDRPQVFAAICDRAIGFKLPWLTWPLAARYQRVPGVMRLYRALEHFRVFVLDGRYRQRRAS